MKKKPVHFDADEINLIKLARDYSDNDKARELLESLRWPEGPVCPHCKATEIYKLTARKKSKAPVRKGVYKCAQCRKQFTVTVGTVFEDSHIQIAVWMQAIFILCSSKKAMSAHQLHRMLGITYKSAWFMAHRIRYAMGTGPLAQLLQGTVECDETYVGGKPRPGSGKISKAGRGTSKTPVVALVERGGDVRTKVVANVNVKNLRAHIEKNVSQSAIMNTDQYAVYHNVCIDFEDHQVVNHSLKEYAWYNPDGSVSHVNTAESFFSLLKRGVMGAWHHVSKEHLPKYCDEFAFRWNNRRISDGERMVQAVKVTEGKRLMYRKPKV